MYIQYGNNNILAYAVTSFDHIFKISLMVVHLSELSETCECAPQNGLALCIGCHLSCALSPLR